MDLGAVGSITALLIVIFVLVEPPDKGGSCTADLLRGRLVDVLLRDMGSPEYTTTRILSILHYRRGGRGRSNVPTFEHLLVIKDVGLVESHQDPRDSLLIRHLRV